MTGGNPYFASLYECSDGTREPALVGFAEVPQGQVPRFLACLWGRGSILGPGARALSTRGVPVASGAPRNPLALFDPFTRAFADVRAYLACAREAYAPPPGVLAGIPGVPFIAKIFAGRSFEGEQV